jgi:hypothetical protein
MSLEKCNRRKGTEEQRAPTEISHQIIGASIEVHRTLGGPGLLDMILPTTIQFQIRSIDSSCIGAGEIG